MSAIKRNCLIGIHRHEYPNICIYYTANDMLNPLYLVCGFFCTVCAEARRVEISEGGGKLSELHMSV